MDAGPVSSQPVGPSFSEALHVWLRIGLLSFGGPAGQIALMQRMLVDERRWISDARFRHGLNFCMLLPGPEAMQLATYVGWLLHGVRGGLAAGILFVLPGFLIILALSAAYALGQGQAWFASLFFGLKAAVLAVVLEALVRMARRSLTSGWAYGLAGLAFLALFAFQVPFPLVVLAAGVAGYLKARGTVPEAGMPPDDAAGAGWGDALRTLVVWGTLWVVPVVLVVLLLGRASIYPDLALFFSKMALVTFGGAYAVLSYVAQAAVASFGWLTPGQMIDGLALAETTPGPLILVLAFVGFQAAYQSPGVLSPMAGGMVGAALTVWVTFVPCFLWIFLGAPHVERLRRNVALSGALAGIGASIAGVILNLSVWFGLQTLFARVGTWRAGPLSLPMPKWGSLDPLALGLSLLAVACLFRFKIGMIQTLVLCALLGFAAKSLI